MRGEKLGSSGGGRHRLFQGATRQSLTAIDVATPLFLELDPMGDEELFSEPETAGTFGFRRFPFAVSVRAYGNVPNRFNV
jgi:hypothetical protein